MTRVRNQLRRLRFLHGEMTQAELARRVGVSRQTIVAIEKAKYSPTLELAFQLAAVFESTVSDVFQYLSDNTEPTTPKED